MLLPAGRPPRGALHCPQCGTAVAQPEGQRAQDGPDDSQRGDVVGELERVAAGRPPPVPLPARPARSRAIWLIGAIVVVLVLAFGCLLPLLSAI